MKPLIFFVFLCWLCPVFSQTNEQNSGWMNYIEDLMTGEETDNELLENLLDELSYLTDHPYNLQTVTKEELEKLPFLTDWQIENLLYYIYKYGPLVDIYELKNVEELDKQTLSYLLPFVYVGEPPEKEFRRSLKNSRQELMFRTNCTVQLFADNAYWGDPFYLSLRYGVTVGEKIQFGISGEKDPGEPLWNAHNKVFDYYTFNLAFRKLGVLEELHFGNYRLSFGQGLVMNNDFSMGKTADVLNINRKSSGIKRHVSTNENQYFSGIAGKVKWKNTRLTLFYSGRRHDASTRNDTITTFKTDGYHRTYNDWLKRGMAEIETAGGNVQWQKDQLSVGFTAVQYAFGGKTLNPDLKAYNLYYLRGKTYWNTSLDYSFSNRKWDLQGEIALDRNGKTANLHQLTFKPAPFADWVMAFRYYDKQYNAFYGKSFSESSTVQNEIGLYNGLKIKILSKWEISTYWDYFTFPWLKYGTDSPSSGNDISIQIKYQPNEKWQMTGRYKFKEKEKNGSGDDDKKTAILLYETSRWRYQCNFAPSLKFQLKTQADYVRYLFRSENQQAWSLTQSFSYIPDKSKFQLDGALAYFHTGSWDTRITVFEKNILYAFSFPTYYGKGFRYYAVFKWKIIKPLTFYFKCGSTHYTDKETDAEKTDVYGLLRYTF